MKTWTESSVMFIQFDSVLHICNLLVMNHSKLEIKHNKETTHKKYISFLNVNHRYLYIRLSQTFLEWGPNFSVKLNREPTIYRHWNFSTNFSKFYSRYHFILICLKVKRKKFLKFKVFESHKIKFCYKWNIVNKSTNFVLSTHILIIQN